MTKYGFHLVGESEACASSRSCASPPYPRSQLWLRGKRQTVREQKMPQDAAEESKKELVSRIKEYEEGANADISVEAGETFRGELTVVFKDDEYPIEDIWSLQDYGIWPEYVLQSDKRVVFNETEVVVSLMGDYDE